MSTIKHENINQFIGVCIVAPNVCILMQYAYKGCLRDVLLNDSMNINADFLHSFVLDIAGVSTIFSLFHAPVSNDYRDDDDDDKYPE